MSSRAPLPHPATPAVLPAADTPFVRRWPQAAVPHWRDPQLPTLAQMLRRYGREGSVLSALPHQPELQQIDPMPTAPAAHAAESSWDDRDTVPQPLPEPFTEPLEGLQTREINDDTVFSTLFGELR
ncbi:MAG: hypothetical protein ACKVQR_14905 [Aquabacterium sp.]